jgi:hypothetical protein
VKHVHRHWLPCLLGLCALLTLVLLVWPDKGGGPPRTPSAEHYAGPDFETRRSGQFRRFSLRLGGPTAPPDAASVAEPRPVLVGIAGRRAYLRGADGEVKAVSIGQSVDGWGLVAVSGRAATLRGPNGDIQIEMFATDTGPPAPPADIRTPPTQGV